MVFPKLTRKWRPETFQGNKTKKSYFEGWYIKLVSSDKKHSCAFIPGISLTNSKEIDKPEYIRNPAAEYISNERISHSFIQYINGNTGHTEYLSYPVDEFESSYKGFYTSIAQNTFSLSGMSMRVSNNTISFSGDIGFSNRTSYPSSFLSPGIMGWYSFVPFMECYHGIVSMYHTLQGKLNLPEGLVDFTGGHGYIEKDWGRSMPEAWIWAHTNSFKKTGVSLMLSVARIPWLGSSFPGFLCSFLIDGDIYTWATYTGAKIYAEKIPRTENKEVHSAISKDSIHSDNFLSLSLSGKHGYITISSYIPNGHILQAPNQGSMSRSIREALNAELEVTFIDKSGNLKFHGSGKPAGLELVGDIYTLFNEV